MGIVKKTALIVLCLGAALVQLAVGALVFACAKPPAISYGAGRYSLFKSFASDRDCRALSDFLMRGTPAEFNRYRTDRGLSRTYLRFANLLVCARDLRNIDLSRCVLEDCCFSGCDLGGASFKESYLAQTSFHGSYQLEEYPTPQMARPTVLSRADFEAAQFGATLYARDEIIGYSHFRVEATGFEFCERDGAKCLPQIPALTVPLALTPGGARVVVPAPSAQTARFLDVSIPCANPFEVVPESLHEAWKKMGVDVAYLKTLPARRLERERMGLNPMVANPDADLIVVTGGPPEGWPEIASAGPVVVGEESSGLRSVLSDRLLWLRDSASAPNLYAGRPVIAGPHVHGGLDTALLSPVFHEPLVGPVPPKDEWLQRLLARESIEEVARRLGGHDAVVDPSEACDLAGLRDILGTNRLDQVVEEHPEMRAMTFKIVRGSHSGSGAIDVVQRNASTVLVLDKGFSTHGTVFAAGPVIAGGDTGFTRILSQSWIDGRTEYAVGR